MRPDPAKVLFTVAGALGAQVLPEVQTPFAQQTTTLSALLSVLLAQEFDRAAANLAEENAAVAAILAKAAGVVPDAALRERIREAAGRPRGQDLRVSALEVENDALRAALIDAHAAVERIDSEEARGLNEQIWNELRASTRRRHLESML